MELYPGIYDDLYALDGGFKWMILGFPRWVPLPGLLVAHIARRRLELGLSGLHKALDKAAAGEELGAGWTDLADVSDVMKLRSKLYREQGVPEDVRLALDIDFVMALVPPLDLLGQSICSNILASLPRSVLSRLRLSRAFAQSRGVCRTSGQRPLILRR